jgi:hypothetical protein
MAFNINEFKNLGLTSGGVRPSLFQVTVFTPPNVGDANAMTKFQFTCRASEVPAATIESINVPYFGRQIKLAGDRTFADWSVTVMNDEDFLVRNMFEDWSNQINQLVGNVKELPENTYKNTDAFVTQYSKDGFPIRQYRFAGIFPTSVAAMGLDWDTTNTIQTFDVTFAYDYWVPVQFGGDITSTINTGEPGGFSSSFATFG